jgi:hypothetical protein
VTLEVLVAGMSSFTWRCFSGGGESIFPVVGQLWQLLRQLSCYGSQSPMYVMTDNPSEKQSSLESDQVNDQLCSGDLLSD